MSLIEIEPLHFYPDFVGTTTTAVTVASPVQLAIYEVAATRVLGTSVVEYSPEESSLVIAAFAEREYFRSRQLLGSNYEKIRTAMVEGKAEDMAIRIKRLEESAVEAAQPRIQSGGSVVSITCSVNRLNPNFFTRRELSEKSEKFMDALFSIVAVGDNGKGADNTHDQNEKQQK